MADTSTPTVEQLQAELLALQERHAVALAENATLRDQHAATADILHVIATSPTNVKNALMATAQAALRIVDAHMIGITQPPGW